MFLPVSAWAQFTVPSGTTFDAMFPACALASGATTPILTTPSGEQKCHIQPYEQKVTFYRILACTAAPTGPTTTSAAVLTNCTTVFSSTLSGGSEVSIVRGTAQAIDNVSIGTGLEGTGPYTHLYLELSPTTKIKARFEAESGTTWNFQTGTSTGRYCQTVDKTYFDYAASSDKMGVVCDTSAFTTEPGTNTITFNSVAAGSAGGANFALLNAPTSSYGEGSLDAYLIKSDSTLVDSGSSGIGSGNANSVAKLSAVLTLGTAISIPANVCGFDVGWNNSRGAGLRKGDRAGTSTLAVGGFDPGPFDMTFTIKNTSTGTCQ